MVYHPEKDYIITGDWKGLLKIWDLTSKERKAILRGNKASIQDLKVCLGLTILIQPKNQPKFKIIGILEEIDSFY